jgi:glycosyltransferase involved in cell wall biosynthesis
MAVATVILNSYNQARWLPEAIESVLGQTEADIRLLGIDNGSTDESHEIFRRYADDPRVQLVLHDRNEAISKRFNEAVALVTTPYVSFLYSDDYLLPDKIAVQAAELDRRGPRCGVVYGPYYGESAATGERWLRAPIRRSGMIFRDLMQLSAAGQIDMSTPLVRVECLRQHPFDESVFAEGEAIWFRIALTHELGARVPRRADRRAP